MIERLTTARRVRRTTTSHAPTRHHHQQHDRPRPAPEPRPLLGFRSARGAAAWMLVLPVDALAIVLPVLWAPHYLKACIALSVLGVVLLTGGGRYRARLHLSVLDELPTIVCRLLVAVALVAAVFVLRHDGDGVLAYLTTSLAVIPLVLAGRVLTTWFLLAARRRRVVAHPTLLVGGGALATEVAGLLDRYPRYGLRVVGYVDDHPPAEVTPASAAGIPHVGSTTALPRLAGEAGVEVVLVTDGHFDETQLLDRLRAPGTEQCDLLVVPRLHAFRTQVGLGDHIGSIPVMRIGTPSLRGPWWALKRAFDVVVASAALVLLSPVMLGCALLVRWESGAGVLFRQSRVGKDGREFTCLKFRSMRPTSATEAATRWTVADDPRIGWVGRLLRRTSLDELPQLWNIVRGDMTIVGPRPERPHFVSKFSAELPRYDHRHRVPAGLTGLAQVSGLRGDTPVSDRARYDNYYIENWSLWLDAKVLLRTVSEVLFARGR